MADKKEEGLPDNLWGEDAQKVQDELNKSKEETNKLTQEEITVQLDLNKESNTPPDKKNVQISQTYHN